MAAVTRKQEVITRLTTYYSDLTDDAAGRIYDEAMSLYHESLTYTSFYLLLERDEKIISALVTIIIFEIDLDRPNGLHGQIMMFILLHSHLFKSFNTNLNLLEQQRKEMLENVEKQEAKKLIESDLEEEIKKIDDLYEDFNVIKLPLLDDEVRGAQNINSFSQHLLKQYKL